MLRPLRDAILGFTRARTMTFFAILATGFSLLVLGLFALALLNLNTLIRYFENKVEIVAYLKDDANSGEVGMAVEQLSLLEGVAQVNYLSKEEALEQFRSDLGPDNDLLQDLEANPVPASFNITMQPGYRDTLHVKAVADEAAAYAFVEDVDYGREWLRRMDVFKHVVSVVGIGAAALLALVSVVLISSAIKIAIFSRQKDIFIMKIVGATNGYIRRSFLLEGFLKGACGGLLASILVYTVSTVFSRKVYSITSFGSRYYLYMVLAGSLMGLLGSWLSLGRYLRRI